MSDRVNAAIPAWVRQELDDDFAEEVFAAQRFLRNPSEVMDPACLQAMTATRLSFARTLVQHMASGAWNIELKDSQIAADGTGLLAYEITADDEVMHFGAFAYPPLPVGHQRLFRDTKTDFFGALVAGPLDMERLWREKSEFDERLWRGRSDNRVFGWTIASRGTRTFEDVVTALSHGEQPDPASLDQNGGYILRNGGYYGNGRMGTRAWQSYGNTTGPLSTPYHVDLFCLYLWRIVSFDVVEAAARARSARAVPLHPELKRYLGVGNSSGLGTVAALIRWPSRLSSYILARELAFAYVKSKQEVTERLVDQLASLLTRAAVAYSDAPPADPTLLESREQVAQALRSIANDLQCNSLFDGAAHPWLALVEKSEQYKSREATELLHSLLLELYPEVDQLQKITVAGIVRHVPLEPAQTVEELKQAISDRFEWALQQDLDDPLTREYFWYRSEENGENRRGERSRDVGVERETFIDVAGAVTRLYDFLVALPPQTTVGRFLLENPEHTLAVHRVQLSRESPFSEIGASVCSAYFKPSAGIRCFLTVLGLELPAPHSERWVRGVFYRGAPLPQDLVSGEEGDWVLPTLSQATHGTAASELTRR